MDDKCKIFLNAAEIIADSGFLFANLTEEEQKYFEDSLRYILDILNNKDKNNE